MTNDQKIARLSALFDELRELQKTHPDAVNSLPGALKLAVKDAKQLLDQQQPAMPTKSGALPDGNGQDPEALLLGYLKTAKELWLKTQKATTKDEAKALRQELLTLKTQYEAQKKAWESDFLDKQKGNIGELEGHLTNIDTHLKGIVPPTEEEVELEAFTKQVEEMLEASASLEEAEAWDKLKRDLETFDTEYKPSRAAWPAPFVESNKKAIAKLESKLDLIRQRLSEGKFEVKKEVKTFEWSWRVVETKGHRYDHKQDKLDKLLRENGVHPDQSKDDNIHTYQEAIAAMQGGKGKKLAQDYLASIAKIEAASETAVMTIELSVEKKTKLRNKEVVGTTFSILSAKAMPEQTKGDGDGGALSFEAVTLTPTNKDQQAIVASPIVLKRSKAKQKKFLFGKFMEGLFTAGKTVVDEEKKDHENKNMIPDPNDPNQEIEDTRAEKIDDAGKIIADVEAGYNAIQGAFEEGEVPEMKIEVNFSVTINGGAAPNAKVTAMLKDEEIKELEYAKAVPGKKFIYHSFSVQATQKLEKELNAFLK